MFAVGNLSAFTRLGSYDVLQKSFGTAEIGVIFVGNEQVARIACAQLAA